jgi:acyl transferase domain-containing protein/NAD(P)-dependent dehydrogenase (short-subunit alcohol dehydrogenase family)
VQIHHHVAVVGVGALFPGSNDKTGFWRDILAGRDLISEVPPTHWRIEDYYDPDPSKPDKIYAKRGAFISPQDFDPMEFAVPPANLSSTDTAQLLALLVAKQVLDDAARGQFAAMDRDRISVVLGVASATELVVEMGARLQRPVWARALRQHGLPDAEIEAICDRITRHYVPWTENTFPGLLGNVVAGRVANRFDLRGTNCVVDAACASSLSAVHLAMLELETGHSDLVISGGVDMLNDVLMYTCFSKTPALSPTGDCRPFSDAADGTILGEGIGMVALKRLSDAQRDGDRIYAVIRGLGTSSDGLSKSIYAPVPAGQARALERAYQAAGYGPETVELLEAHGTATRAGDTAELEGLRLVFGAGATRGEAWCALGSVKSQIGHTKAAAGSAGLFKAVMALHHKVLPPTIKVETPNPALQSPECPFYVNTRARPWIRGGDHPRRASVSSFGFGGSNYHLTLEEYTGSSGPRGRVRTFTHELLLLQAATPGELVEQCQAFAASPQPLDRLAWESQQAWRGGAYRLAAVVSEATRRELLSLAAERIAREPEQVFSLPTGLYYGLGPIQGSVAFLFPGQGSQYVNMGADLAMAFDAARAVWDEAADGVGGIEGLARRVFPPPALSEATRVAQEQALTQTQWAQPAIGAVSLSHLALLRQLEVTPAALAGHSFGEVTALMAAGCLGPADFLQVARQRGALMAAASVQPGAMTAVTGAPPELTQDVERAGHAVVLANHNSPSQMVFAGTVEAIERFEAWLSSRALTPRRLPVSTAFHSPLVAPSVEPFKEFLRGIPIAAPALPVIGNADAQAFPADPRAIADQLAEQIARPVLFTQQVEALHAAGVRVFLEVGPRGVLTGLVEQTLGARPHLAVSMERSGMDGVCGLWHALGRLAAAGVAINPLALWAEYGEPKAVQAHSRPALTVPILGANHGRPYPCEPSEHDMHSKPSPSPAPVAAPTPIPADTTLPITRASPTTRAEPSGAAVHHPLWGPLQGLAHQLAESQASFQEVLAQGHARYMGAMESVLSQLAATLGGPMPAYAPASMPATGGPMSVAPIQEFVMVDPAPATTSGPALGPAESAASPQAQPATRDPDRQEVLFRVVADKTGYPVEMLSLEQELEAGLGIDSIKRVEILADLRERYPSMPEPDPTRLGSIQTLRDVLVLLEGDAAAPASVSQPPVVSSVTMPPQEPESIPAALVRRRPVARAQAASGFAMRGLLGPDTQVAVTRDGLGVAQALVALLEVRGVRACVMDAGDLPAGVTGLILLSGLAAVDGLAEGVHVCKDALSLASRWADTLARPGGLFVTVQDTGGGFGIDPPAGTRAALGGLAALARTAAQEWPETAVKTIDLPCAGRSASDLAQAIADELLAGGPEREVGLPGPGQRLVLADEACEPPEGDRVIGPHSVVVATGGGRGVTACCLQALAGTGARVALLGRTEWVDDPAALEAATTEADVKRVLMDLEAAAGRSVTPSRLSELARGVMARREVRLTLRRLEEAGLLARYIEADVADPQALGAALADVRQAWGPVTCVIHGAGVLADKAIRDKTREHWDAVFRAKVDGLLTLLDATRDDPLEALVLFSSVVARVGNPGQSDYAMANEILHQVAAHEAARRPGCLVRSIGWGPWAAGMVTPGLRAMFASRAVPMLSEEQGAQAFLQELRRGSEAVVVSVAAGQPEAILAAAGAARQEEVEICIDADTCPFLESHRIDGAAVVPTVLVAEWVVRAARVLRPESAPPVVRDLRILRGVVMKAWPDATERLTLRLRPQDGGLACEIRRPGSDALHYSAFVSFGGRPSRPVPAGADLALGPWRLSPQEAYGEHLLFHGPAFQAIRAFTGWSERGASATLSGCLERGWPASGRALDLAVLDGALQVAAAWSHQAVGAQALPTRIAEMHVLPGRLAEGPIECLVRVVSSDASRTVTDLVLRSADGSTLALLLGLEMHHRRGRPSDRP